MVRNTMRHTRLLITVLVGIALCTLGAGFYNTLSAEDEETYQGLRLFTDVIELIEQNYVDPVDSKEMLQKAIQGMVHSLDPHSQFLPPEAFEELRVDTKGEFGGIGIVLTARKGNLTVISPIDGTPAYKAGILPGDIIIKVDGALTREMMLWEAVKKMRGPKGEPVVITIVRKGEPDPIEFTLIRDIIPIQSVKYLDLKDGYGYVWITNFQENTTEDLVAALDTLSSEETPLKGLLLDLRDNPGGLLNQSINVADLFIKEGAIVSIKGRDEKNTKIFNADPETKKYDFPIVLLINGGSASASEIVAGALQDHQRAVLLGTTTFGKGSVQTVESLRGGYGLKFTIARYYTPDGRSIQAEGIEPDITVEAKTIETKPDDKKRRMLKEKDLKNHLDPEETPDPSDAKSDKKSEPPDDLPKSRHGPLSLERLMSDYQVQRGLDILVSYDIFKGLNR